MTAVSIVRCPSYDPASLDRAVAEAIELAGGIDVKGATVLVKPNILNSADPDKAVTTHPELLRAVLRRLRALGAARLLVGDSPGWQAQDYAGRRTGLAAAAAAEGAEWSDFSQGREVECPEGLRVRRFTLAAALAEADVLVSLPKLKTHRLMYFTGAIKNLFGLVPGLAKSQFHLRFPEPSDFGAMLVDLALAARPAFSLMDAVVGMEGPGPNAGSPRRLGLVMASRDPLALDWSAASLVGYHPARIPYLADALSRGAWITSPEDIKARGERPEDVRPSRFELVRSHDMTDFFAQRMPGFAHRVLKSLAVARPVFDHGRCVRCGGCVRICPPAALAMERGMDGLDRVSIDRTRCIHCYCCHEACPEDAIRLVRRPF